MVLGACLGCLAPTLTIAACMSHKSPFVMPFDKKDEAEGKRKALAAPGVGVCEAGAGA